MPSPTSLIRRIVVAVALLAAGGVTVSASPAAADPTPPGVVAMARDNGRVEVAERTGTGAVRVRGFQNGAWGTWLNLEGIAQHDPDITSWGNERADVFAIGADGALWHRAQIGATWGAWESLGGYATSSPAAVSWGPNRIDVFARGLDGAVWGRSFNGSAWSGWYSLGGYTLGAPTVASWGVNRLDVFAAGGDRQLWRRGFAGSWMAWEPLGGVLTAAPGAVAWGPGRVDVIARGGDNAVWGLSWLGTRWGPWYSLGGLTIGAPDVASRSAGTLDVLARGVDNRLFMKSYNGAAWSGWALVPSLHQGVEVDDSRIPAPAQGFSASRIGPARWSPEYSDGVGAFRVNCYLSHMNYDDPIVFPGQVDSTHLHAYFGNTAVNAFSNTRSIATTGDSTCTGGTANRSAYWAPAMIDTATLTPVQPWGENGLQVYYKSGYRGVPSNLVVNFPAGLRMIAGDSRRSTPFQGAVVDSPVNYHCINTSGGTAIQLAMPNCPPGQQLAMAIRFPQCWDGVNLDSPNHQSHMAYGTWGPIPGRNGAGCPASHPVPLPEITMNMRYVVPPGGMAAWRLSSDTYSGPAGYSGHADWWNGWHAPTLQRVLTNCFTTGLDCRMNLLGDGQALL